MLSGKWLLLLALFASSPGRHYPLPSTAAIVIGPLQRNMKDSLADSAYCKNYHLTERQVRMKFRTYHELTGEEFHYKYDYLPCWIEGTIQFQGKTYTWSSQPENTMETTWPDGVKKTLGGRYTDDGGK